jgi:hypothetical protein
MVEYSFDRIKIEETSLGYAVLFDIGLIGEGSRDE